MTRNDLAFWFLAGLGTWALATAGLAVLGGLSFESGPVVYLGSVVSLWAAFVVVFALAAAWRRTSRERLAQAAAIFAAAGLAGEVPVLLTFPAMVPSLSAASVGSFAAFLLGGYAVLLGYVVLRAVRAPALSQA